MVYIDGKYKFNITTLDYSELHQQIIDDSLTGNLVGVSTCKDGTYDIEISFTGTGQSDDRQLSSGDETTLNSTVSGHSPDTLAILKDKLDAQIDRKAFKRFQQLLTFTYDSKSFSLSTNAQQKIKHYYDEKATITYPKKFTTKDNKDSTSIANSTDMTNFYNAMVGDFITEMDLIQDTKYNVNTAVDANAAQAAADAYLDL